MEKREFRKNAADMIYLTACAINNKKPKKERVDALDLPKLFEVCQKHILTACAACALESAGVREADFTQAKEKAVRKNILLDAERSKILKRLEEEKIWYAPLKGALLKDWYPKLGMRQMSDNDILVDGGKAAEVRDIFLDLGYVCEEFGQANRDVYFKEPVLNFEMHGSLFHPAHIGALYPYFKDVKERLIREEGSEYGYRFTNEDFYLFMIAHEYKHFAGGGTGVRSLADTYVFLRKFGGSLDWGYVGAELEKLGIADFERDNRGLAMKVFALKPLTPEEKKLLDYYVTSGIYGNVENVVNNLVERGAGVSKAKYLWRRIFPPMSVYETWYPWAYKRRILLPAAWAARLAGGLIEKRGAILLEIRTLLKKRR